MLKATLTMALDFARAKKGPPVPHEQFSYQHDGTWYVVHCGPTYSNTLKILEFDAEGLAKLQRIERKEQPCPPIKSPVT